MFCGILGGDTVGRADRIAGEGTLKFRLVKETSALNITVIEQFTYASLFLAGRALLLRKFQK